MNWRGRPLVNLETVVNLIASTTTEKGLKIQADLDRTIYPTGIKVSDQKLETINLKEADFHGKWNYCILPDKENRGSKPK
jgi:hypothetical protein